MARITPPSGGLSEPLALVSPLTVDQIDETTPDAGVTIETVLLKDGQVDGVDVSALDAFPYTFPFDFLAAPAHATLHSDGGTDEVTVENLATAGAVNAVPTSDGAGGLAMSVPALGGPTIYLVTADQDIDTDITMNNVTNMAWTVEAGHTYYVEGILRTISPAAADVDLLVTIPAGADVLLNTLGLTAPVLLSTSMAGALTKPLKVWVSYQLGPRSTTGSRVCFTSGAPVALCNCSSGSALLTQAPPQSSKEPSRS